MATVSRLRNICLWDAVPDWSPKRTNGKSFRSKLAGNASKKKPGNQQCDLEENLCWSNRQRIIREGSFAASDWSAAVANRISAVERPWTRRWWRDARFGFLFRFLVLFCWRWRNEAGKPPFFRQWNKKILFFSIFDRINKKKKRWNTRGGAFDLGTGEEETRSTDENSRNFLPKKQTNKQTNKKTNKPKKKAKTNQATKLLLDEIVYTFRIDNRVICIAANACLSSIRFISGWACLSDLKKRRHLHKKKARVEGVGLAHFLPLLPMPPAWWRRFFLFPFCFRTPFLRQQQKKRIKQRPSPSKLKTKIKTKEKVHFDGRKYSWAFFDFILFLQTRRSA